MKSTSRLYSTIFFKVAVIYQMFQGKGIMADSLDNSGTSSWYSNNDIVGPAKYIELHSIDP
jgi:hypothetical protein